MLASIQLVLTGVGSSASCESSIIEFLNWQELGIIVLTNACRSDPAKYKDAYVGSYNILNPEVYPAVKPVYPNFNLCLAARAHSADMADNCGLNHNSCDNTSWDKRIQSFYDNKSQIIAENIAAGSTEPQETMNQWLIDGNPPPLDMTTDGHRRNIMNPDYNEVGTGYAEGSQQYRYFWTQDFGGGVPEEMNRIVCGSHFFFDDISTTFMANYYDKNGTAPKSASVIIEGEEHELSAVFGSGGNASYAFSEKQGSRCRYYSFVFIDSENAEWRYPESGFLLTCREGNCDSIFRKESASVLKHDFLKKTSVFSRIEFSRQKIVIEGCFAYPLSVRLFSVTGRAVETGDVLTSFSEGWFSSEIPVLSKMSKGTYCMSVKMSDNSRRQFSVNNFPFQIDNR